MSSSRRNPGSTRTRGDRNRESGQKALPPVPLHKRSSSHFRPATRDRGNDAFDAGRIRFDIDGARLLAQVDDGNDNGYRVGLDWSQVAERRALHAFCECRRFAGGTPCEHVWAALLALNAAGEEMQPPGRDRVSLRKDRASSWEELGVAAGAEPSPPETGSRRASRPRRPSSGPRHPSVTSWQSQLDSLGDELDRLAGPDAGTASPGRIPDDLRFLIDLAASRESAGLVIDLFSSRSGRGGKPGRLKRANLEPDELAAMLLPEGAADGDDSSLAVVATLAPSVGPRKGRGKRQANKGNGRIYRFQLPRRLYETVLSHLSAAGALGWWDGRRPASGQSLDWDDGSAWSLTLRLEATAESTLRLRGRLERNGDIAALSAPLLMLPTESGRPLLVFKNAIGRLDMRSPSELHWIKLLRDAREIVIPRRDLEEAFAKLHELPDLPELDVPEELELTQETAAPRPRLVLRQDSSVGLPDAPLLAELSFQYGDTEVSVADGRSVAIDWPSRTLVRRDMEWEHEALVRVLEAGVQPLPDGQGHELRLRPQRVPAVAEPLLLEGWIVEVSGTSLRAPSRPALRIDSGIDWFELGGEVGFAGNDVDFKRILEAVKKGERFVELEDGSKGLVPTSWSETYDSLAKLAHDSSDAGLRFLPSQALFVDALLTEMPPAAVDKAFAELREELRSFDSIKPKKEPRGFKGTLRGYQREGLGWLGFLRRFGLGGVLADDMGLGKTVQVLALLRANRTASTTTGLPWLVVVPRSLLYNWQEEAARFTPNLKVVEYGGPGREALQDKIAGYDLVLTTYGTLRRDIGFLAQVEFDTVVLDEAQAIKNPESQSAKACRGLTARNRLALTGTPIENHLGELGSIFEFLNPGFLGRLPVLEILTSSRNASREELQKLADGIRPFILRRTKAQVLPDLPPKTEQALFCTLGERQREIYDQVRAGYQASLLEQAESEGVGRNAIQVLEALLRLRQIACHPGLVNDDWEEAGSAKLETLFELVDEVLDEGHKALIFSQFTSLLAYVRRRLEERDIPYAYLDGQTRNRAEVVERFQEDPDCNLFVVSLKAGGVGLNLTAAGYVFLLDPWWNPAVEAQAIDRAHRIGQTQPVNAYKLIARDTVEEKILELQTSKRKIADAILEGEGASVKDLTADDLRMLLS